jgi:hypothetical protein
LTRRRFLARDDQPPPSSARSSGPCRTARAPRKHNNQCVTQRGALAACEGRPDTRPHTGGVHTLVHDCTHQRLRHVRRGPRGRRRRFMAHTVHDRWQASVHRQSSRRHRTCNASSRGRQTQQLATGTQRRLRHAAAERPAVAVQRALTLCFMVSIDAHGVVGAHRQSRLRRGFGLWHRRHT